MNWEPEPAEPYWVFRLADGTEHQVSEDEYVRFTNWLRSVPQMAQAMRLLGMPLATSVQRTDGSEITVSPIGLTFWYVAPEEGEEWK
jgi:hypothetical protein